MRHGGCPTVRVQIPARQAREALSVGPVTHIGVRGVGMAPVAEPHSPTYKTTVESRLWPLRCGLEDRKLASTVTADLPGWIVTGTVKNRLDNILDGYLVPNIIFHGFARELPPMQGATIANKGL